MQKQRNESATNERKEKIIELIKQDTFSRSEICKQVGIGRTVFYEWLKNDPEFAAQVDNAEKELMNSLATDAKVSLRKLINGYTAKETTTIYLPSKDKDEKGRPIPIIKEQKTIEKPVPPNTGAVIFALTNLDPDNWKNRQETSAKVEGKIESPIYNAKDLPDDVLKEIADKLQDAAQMKQ